MARKGPNERDLKLTAAVYATSNSVVQHLRTTGALPDPDTFPNGGMPIALRVLIERRGVDLVLTADEQLVYDAIVRERRLPGGYVIPIDDADETTGE